MPYLSTNSNTSSKNKMFKPFKYQKLHNLDLLYIPCLYIDHQIKGALLYKIKSKYVGQGFAVYKQI